MTYATITPSPTNPGIEVVDGLCIARHVPYDAHSVTLQFSPFIESHEPNADTQNVQVRQVAMTTAHDETISLSFDLRGTKQHRVTAMGIEYEVELLNISTNDGFPSYVLEVSRVTR